MFSSYGAIVGAPIGPQFALNPGLGAIQPGGGLSSCPASGCPLPGGGGAPPASPPAYSPPPTAPPTAPPSSGSPYGPGPYPSAPPSTPSSPFGPGYATPPGYPPGYIPPGGLPPTAPSAPAAPPSDPTDVGALPAEIQSKVLAAMALGRDPNAIDKLADALMTAGFSRAGLRLRGVASALRTVVTPVAAQATVGYRWVYRR